MYRILLIARAGIAVAFISFLGAAIIGVSDTVKAAFLSTFFLFLFTDGLMSYLYPQLARRTPETPLFANLSKLSFFSDPDTSRGYTLCIAILAAALCISALAKLFGFW